MYGTILRELLRRQLLRPDADRLRPTSDTALFARLQRALFARPQRALFARQQRLRPRLLRLRRLTPFQVLRRQARQDVQLRAEQEKPQVRTTTIRTTTRFSLTSNLQAEPTNRTPTSSSAVLHAARRRTGREDRKTERRRHCHCEIKSNSCEFDFITLSAAYLFASICPCA